MADEGNQENGNRATVALAVEKIDGLRELTRAEFADVKERIGKLEGLPERVTRLEAQREADAGRIQDLEDADRARAIHWPTLLVSLAAIAASTYAALT